MNIHIDHNRPFAEAIRRVMLDAVDETVEQLRGRRRDREEAVHEARKTLKVLRALLRLVRSEIGDGHYKRENYALRDVGRMLADARDAAAVVEALDALVEAHPSARRSQFKHVRRLLERRHDEISKRLFDSDDAVDDAAAILQAHREVLASMELPEEFPAADVRRTYERARMQMGRAWATRSESEHHEWRKQIKYLWNQTRVLVPLRPTELGEREESLHAVSDDLGDAHDVVVLRDYILDCDECDDQERERIVEICQPRIQELHERAALLGHELLAEHPDTYAARMSFYWAEFDHNEPVLERSRDGSILRSVRSRATSVTDAGSGSSGARSGSRLVQTGIAGVVVAAGAAGLMALLGRRSGGDGNADEQNEVRK